MSARWSVAAIIAAAISALPQSAEAQFRFIQLTGTVYDSATVEPLVSAVISLEGTELFGITNSAGAFALNNVQPGTYVLQFHRKGFYPRRFEIDLSAVEPGQLELGSVLLAAEPAGVTVFGSVRDSVSGAPISGGVVSINGVGRGMTNANGVFQVNDVPPGATVVEVRRIGYSPVIRDTVATEGAELTMSLSMHPMALELTEIVVEGERTLYVSGRMRGFYERRETGIGKYFTRMDIERRQPRLVSELFYTVPGYRVTNDPNLLGQNSLSIRNCGKPDIYIDGIPLDYTTLDDLVIPEHVQAIEAYRGMETPAQYHRVGSCGAVLVWTR
jgi:Carboxypeptidase regulatory-like domain/TonB-dependent Receptor Plug Domain